MATENKIPHNLIEKIFILFLWDALCDSRTYDLQGTIEALQYNNDNNIKYESYFEVLIIYERVGGYWSGAGYCRVHVTISYSVFIKFHKVP